MRPRFRLAALLWWAIPACALILFAVMTDARRERVEQVTALDGWYADAPVRDDSVPTGFAEGQRRLIVPERATGTWRWIAQAQAHLSEGRWRVRRIDSENAPYGRLSTQPSPYGWYVAGVAALVGTVSGWSSHGAVEAAALLADPLALAAALLGLSVWVLRRWGQAAAAVLAAGLVTTFPFSGTFLPGVLQPHGLALLGAAVSVLPLLFALRREQAMEPSRRRRTLAFALAGAISGLVFWISPASQAAVILGLLGGAVVEAGWSRRTLDLEWRVWAWAGAAVTCAGYLVEYAPGYLGVKLEVAHPRYALAWLGATEVILTAAALAAGQRAFRWPRLVAAAAGVIVLVLCATGFRAYAGTGLFATDTDAERLSYLPGWGGVAASSLGAWLQAEPNRVAQAAALAPLAWLAAALVLLVRERARRAGSAALVLAVAVAFAAAVLGACQLRWWPLAQLTSLLAGLLVVTDRIRGGGPLAAAGWSLPVALLCVPGAVLLWPGAAHRAGAPVSTAELESLILRDVAHALAQRAPEGAVVLAPPETTAALSFHARLRSIGTLYWENRDGMAAALAIARATGLEESLALLRQRQVRFVVLPSWDRLLDDVAAGSGGRRETTFLAELRRLELPAWVRPLPFLFPDAGDGVRREVLVFEISAEGEEPGEALALARRVDFLLEMERLPEALRLWEALREHPADLGAQVARARLAAASGESAVFAAEMESVAAYLDAGADDGLAWDQRVNLAVVLAHSRRRDPARQQVERCWADATPEGLRALAPGAVFRLLTLTRGYTVEGVDPGLRQLAEALLPPRLRSRD